MSEQDLPLRVEDDVATNTAAERERLALVQMRTELLAFLDSPAGLLLRDRAQQQKDAALAELVKTDPTNTERIRALQGEVLRVDGFTDWLFDLLYAGEQAADGAPEPTAD